MSRRTIGSLLVRLGMDTKEADKAIKNFDRNLKNTAKSLEGIGTRMTIGFTVPIVAGMRQAIKGMNEEAQAAKRLEVAIGGTSKALLDQAAAYHKTTLFQDDQIISAQAYAAALGHSEAETKKMTDAAVQLAAGLGIDLQSAMEMLHKSTTGSARALGQMLPEVKNMTAEQLKSGAAIDLVSSKFRGYAEAATEVGSGPLEMFNKKLVDIGEDLAKTLLPYLERLSKWLGNTLEAFNNLSEGTKQFIVVAGALVAAGGPLMVYMSMLPRLIRGTLDFADALRKMATMKVAGGSALSLLSSGGLPALLAAGGSAAIGGALGENSGLFGGMEKVSGEEMSLMDKAFAGIKLSTGLSQGPGGLAGQAGSMFMGAIAEQEQKKFVETGDAVSVALENLKIAANQAASIAASAAAKAKAKKPKGPAAPKVKDNSIELNMWADAFSPIEDQFLPTPEPIQLGYDPMAQYQSAAGDQFKGVMESIELNWDPLSQYQSKVEDITKVNEQLAQSFQSVSGVANAAFGAMADAILSGENAFLAFGKAALIAAGDIIKASIASAAVKAMEDAVTKFGWIGIALGAAAATGLITLMQGLVTKAGSAAPKLAQGGLAYGPTMAMVGDNPNANIDPEVISPLSKLKSMIQGAGSQTVQVVGVIRGDDILLQTSRANNYAIRRGAGNAISF